MPKAPVNIPLQAIVHHCDMPFNIKGMVKHFRKNEHYSNLILYSEQIENLWLAVKSCFTIVRAGGGLVERNGRYLVMERRANGTCPREKKNQARPWKTLPCAR
ncbi:MAG: hypothetical protein HC896_15815 [Bacteroidales bacterium]|nr:hypothetical protein [Bacteroidales bacterium]